MSSGFVLMTWLNLYWPNVAFFAERMRLFSRSSALVISSSVRKNFSTALIR